MENELISVGRDYHVPYLYCIKGHEKAVSVIIHGFGSSKQSPTAMMMLEELPRHNIGAIAFDLPAHGESPVGGEFLRLSNCLADIEAVETRARMLAPEAEIVYFASSFGAYITLIYLAEKRSNQRDGETCSPPPLPCAFLKSAAVSMPRLFLGRITPERKTLLDSAGEFIVKKEEYSYTRDMKITQGFINDLESHDIFTLWHEGIARLRMIHGEADETILLSDAMSFAEKFNVPLFVVKNGDHQLSISGAPEQVSKLAVEFFAGS